MEVNSRNVRKVKKIIDNFNTQNHGIGFVSSKELAKRILASIYIDRKAIQTLLIRNIDCMTGTLKKDCEIIEKDFIKFGVSIH